ncbi:hypothetical protein BSP36_023 [Bacillus phage BSP36]|nr:hypothetical protein BSP36_023 [Bacillus phage BSP36]
MVKFHRLSMLKKSGYIDSCFKPSGGKVILTPRQVEEFNELMKGTFSFVELVDYIKDASAHGNTLKELSEEELMWVAMGGDYEVKVKPDFLLEIEEVIAAKEQHLKEFPNVLRGELTLQVEALKYARDLYLAEKNYQEGTQEEQPAVGIDRNGVYFKDTRDPKTHGEGTDIKKHE